MKQGWQVRRLSDLVEVSTGPFGSLLHKSDYVDDGVPLVNPVNIVGGRIVPDARKLISEATRRRLSSYILREGDLVVGRRGEIGRCAVVGADESGWVCGTGSFFLRPFPSVDSQFLAYLIRSGDYRDKLEQAATGTTMKNLSNMALAGLAVSVPPLSEQRRIVKVLQEAFNGIATVKENAERNLQNASALFESHLQAALTEHREGWEVKTFYDVCEISSALVDPRGKEYLDMWHVGGANIVSTTGELVGLMTAKEERLVSGKFVFDETMVLYSKIRPYLRKVARPDFQGLCSADIYPLLPKAGKIDRDYLFYLLLSREFTDFANAGSARAGMPKVNRDHLFAFSAHLPPVATQKRIAAKLDALHQGVQRLAATYRKRLAALDELEMSLSHQAFNGKL